MVEGKKGLHLSMMPYLAKILIRDEFSDIPPVSLEPSPIHPEARPQDDTQSSSLEFPFYGTRTAAYRNFCRISRTYPVIF